MLFLKKTFRLNLTYANRLTPNFGRSMRLLMRVVKLQEGGGLLSVL